MMDVTPKRAMIIEVDADTTVLNDGIKAKWLDTRRNNGWWWPDLRGRLRQYGCPPRESH
jgi:hypothetical protein